MGDRSVLLQQEDEGILLLTIDRAARRNAIPREGWLELRDILLGSSKDPAIKGLIITGAGDRSFASGADVSELVDRDPWVALDGLVQGILRQLEDLPLPTVAAINGVALGGGWELALACDFRVASAGARVGFPEVGLGVLPGAGGALRLCQHVGVGRAKEWILTGRILDAHEALVQGLVSEVVEKGNAVDAARELMRAVTSQPKTAVRLSKMLLNAVARGEAIADMERLAYTLAFHSPERSERMRLFLDSRSGRSH